MFICNRLWSKKYPICIILNRNAKVKVEDFLEGHERQKEGEASPKTPGSVADEILDELPDNLSSQHSKSDAGKSHKLMTKFLFQL